MAFIEVSDFSYTYPHAEMPILSHLDFVLESGAFAVITGESGSGKSTLGKALAGFLFQGEDVRYSGQIKVDQMDMTHIALFDAIEKVAYVQQNPQDQFCTLTVLDEIAFGLENLGVQPADIDNRIDEALEIVKGLHLRKRNLATLSGGEQQKVAIASLLALSPNVLILDEPTSNLDPPSTNSVFETLDHLRRTHNLTVIIIEHKLPQLLPLNPELFELANGQLHPTDKKDKLYNPSLNCKKSGLTQTQEVPTNAIISLRNVDINREGRTILDGINLEIKSGEFISLMGSNGSGKTTLLESMMGFHEMTSGQARIFYHDRSKIKISDLVKDIGFIFQNPDHQIFTQSIRDEIVFTSRNLSSLGSDLESELDNWIQRMHLEGRMDDHPQRLSYGEKRRLNLASSMFHSPSLLLIDELLIGQDTGNALIWLNLLKDYTKSGNSVVLVNHHPDFTYQFCDRLVFLDQGKIILDDQVPSAFNKLAELGYTDYLPYNYKEMGDA
jgi:energy-coupling factor transport system ATP-binding protein